MSRKDTLLALAALLVTMAAGSAPASAGAQERSPERIASPIQPLGTEGRWIVDGEGRVVILHGLNMVNKLPPFHPAAIGFGADDARFLRAQGFNSIRLGVLYEALAPEPGVIDEAYLDRIEATLQTLERQGILVLLDFHQDLYAKRFSGEGFPPWAVIDDGLPAQPDVGFPGNYLVMPALNRAFDNFWINRAPAATPALGLQDSLADAWQEVAKRFRHAPNLLGYNLLNEPWPGSQYPTCISTRGCPAFDIAFLTPFSERIIDALRQVDSQGIVWYAPLLTFDFGAATYHGETGDPNAGFAFNNYCLAASPIEDNGGDSNGPCRLQEQRVFDNAEQHSRDVGDALLMTEWGAVDHERVLDRVAELADENMMSWQEWAYFNEDPSGPRPEHNLVRDPSKPPREENLKRDKLEILARAYPRLVAGIPRRWSFDRGEPRFEFVYSTERADGTGSFVAATGSGAGGARSAGRSGAAPAPVTEIFVPELHFGSSYRVEVEGAEVVSSPGAQRLRLMACDDAKRVKVEVSDAAWVETAACPRADGGNGGRPDRGKPGDGGSGGDDGNGGGDPRSGQDDAATTGAEGGGSSADAATGGDGGSLPFTGLLLPGLAALGLLLAGLGIAVRRWHHAAR